MVLSVNTNIGSLIALQKLNLTNSMLDKIQLHITTGLKFNGPKDDASTFAIAQNMRGNVAGMGAVKTALAGGESILDTAIEAAKAVSDILIEMKAKVVQANQEGLDSASRQAVANDFVSLREQITTIVNSAKFNGTNLLDGSILSFSVLSTVDGDTIAIGTQTMTSAAIAIDVLDLSTLAGSQSALSGITVAIDNVSDKLASLGSVARRIELQNDFTTQLKDILTAGIGNLVDADMAEESAKLQALQIKQQLGIQALSIANAAPQNILALFQ